MLTVTSILMNNSLLKVDTWFLCRQQITKAKKKFIQQRNFSLLLARGHGIWASLATKSSASAGEQRLEGEKETLTPCRILLFQFFFSSNPCRPFPRTSEFFCFCIFSLAVFLPKGTEAWEKEKGKNYFMQENI